ncbi:MAG: DUF2007 domain-containing protein [Thermoguttaceae bacterium]|nr:DUF2007 domain-containing protein [Thermoguttaceae bacterium]
MTDAEVREVYSARNVPEAHFIKASLEDAGIEARVVGDQLQNTVLPAEAISPQVLVRGEDYARARELIHQWQTQQHPEVTAPEWTCSACGEPNEPGFEICWNCQAARTDAP